MTLRSHGPVPFKHFSNHCVTFRFRLRPTYISIWTTHRFRVWEKAEAERKGKSFEGSYPSSCNIFPDHFVSIKCRSDISHQCNPYSISHHAIVGKRQNIRSLCRKLLEEVTLLPWVHVSVATAQPNSKVSALYSLFFIHRLCMDVNS